MITYEQLLENNGNWVKEMKASDPAYFENLAKGQKPRFLYIGCVDSRAPIEVMVNAKPGEIFTHRNIANVISLEDTNALSVLYYALNVLKVEHVIVCGHYMCGGVEAGMGHDVPAPLQAWIKNIQKVYDQHKEELNAITDKQDRWNKLAEYNVMAQCANILQTEAYKDAENKPKISGLIYDIPNGNLKEVAINNAIS